MSADLNVAMLDLGQERAGAVDRRRAAVVAAIVILCCALVTPVISVPLGTSYPVFAIVIALSIASIAVTAVLLWAQARVTRSVPLAVLALGYALTAMVMFPYLLFYRGLWPQLSNWVSADAQTAPWLYLEWHALLICSTLAYYVVRRLRAQEPPHDARAFHALRVRLIWIGVALFVLTVPATVWVDDLPKLTFDGHVLPLFIVFGASLGIGAAGAIGVNYATSKFEALLDLWLAVACLSILADLTMTIFSRQFAAGWYVSRLSILLAASSLLVVLLFQTANIYAKLAVTADRLRGDSLTDVLTGLPNRRRFDQYFEDVMRDAARSARTVALLTLDVDNFKAYNDTFGHQAGDECLKSIAAIVQANLGRARDLAARTGGEEMAVIMPEADIRGALTVAERIRAAIEDAALPPGRGAAHRMVTVSIGVAATRDPGTGRIEDLIAAADSALYRAKATGRNRVVESFERAAVLPDV